MRRPYATGTTIGEAYRKALLKTDTSGSHLTVRVTNPVRITDEVPETLTISDWGNVLNVGWEFGYYESYDFERESGKTNGSTGRDWINDRMLEMFEGMYWERAGDQLEQIRDRLKQGNHGACTNALVAQVFGEEDLEKATAGVPSQKGMACITQLQFRPSRKELDLFMTLRSQYIDLKGYGNLISAAALLQKMCHETDYEPGELVETVNNVTQHSQRSLAELQQVIG